MHRSALLQTIASYTHACPEEGEIVKRFREFVEKNPLCFERNNQEGHITGSAYILSKDKKRILLTLHATLNKWLQLGGHTDGEHLVHEAALREAVEESGISKLEFFPFPFTCPYPPAFSFHIHEIPASVKQASHLHYDVSYLLVAQEEHIVCSHESLALQWIPLEEIAQYSQEDSLLKTIQKIKTTLCQL